MQLESADAVLALRPGPIDLDVGAVDPYPPGSAAAFEVRAFFPKDGTTVEDPVTGSLNASLAQWLTATSRAQAPYVASQGTALGRRGRVHVCADAEGAIWVGGATTTRVRRPCGALIGTPLGLRAGRAGIEPATLLAFRLS